MLVSLLVYFSLIPQNMHRHKKSLPLIRKPQTSQSSRKSLSRFSFPSSSRLQSSNAFARDAKFSGDSNRNLLLQSRQGPRADSMDAYSGAIGEKARLDFVDSHRNFPKSAQRNRFEKLEDTPSLAYLKSVDRLRLLPNPIGVVRRKGKEDQYDLTRMSMGDFYAQAFSEGLKHVKSVQRLNLQANRLTEVGTLRILSSVEFRDLKHLNLCQNRIGDRSVNRLVDVLDDRRCVVKSLNLENCALSPRAIKEICASLESNKSVRILNLAKNRINEKSVHFVAELIFRNDKLESLDLHWNHIRGDGAYEVFESLR